MNIVSFFLQCSLLIYAPILFVANDAAEWADCVISRLAQRNSGHTKVGFSPLKPRVSNSFGPIIFLILYLYRVLHMVRQNELGDKYDLLLEPTSLLRNILLLKSH